MAFSEMAFHQCLVRPGTILDIGANVGKFSLPFSTWKDNRLLAFEPYPLVFEVLKKRLTDEHGGQLPPTTTLHMAALGETMGTATLHVPTVTGLGIVHPWASLAKSFEGLDGVAVQAFEVPVWTIDGLGLDDVTAIKLDAEGFEREILHGGRHTIARCRPILSCECEERHREGSTWYIPGFMQGLGYDGWFHHDSQFWPLSSLDRRTMQVAHPTGAIQSDPYISDFLFIPRELPELHQRLSAFGPFRSAVEPVTGVIGVIPPR
jgi:FkbM family methyltransferase